MPAKHSRYAYDEILLSGRAVFFAEGVDYTELPEKFRRRWFGAAKRRGLKLATWTVLDPPGVTIQAYSPNHTRPPRPADPSSTNLVTNAKQHLVCFEIGCKTRLSAREMGYRLCEKHRD